MYIYLKSSDSVNYFPRNNILSFTVKLPERIVLNNPASRGEWRCALVDIKISDVPDIFLHGTTIQPETLYIGSDIIDTSHTAFGRVQILRKLCMTEVKNPNNNQLTMTSSDVLPQNADVTPTRTQTPLAPQLPISDVKESPSGITFTREFSGRYLPVKTSSFSSIQIFLKGEEWKNLSLSENTPSKQPQLYAVLHLTK